MEANVKRREWVKTAAIIFLVVLLVLTFFSNTIMNRSLPEVATQSVQSGSINARIRGSGTVAANETYDVTISQTRKIASVLVKVGQTVEAGDKLFLLDSMESSDLTTARTELESMELNYEKSLIDASNGVAKDNREIQKAQEKYNEALALCKQFSGMSSAQIKQEIASAKDRLKDLQKLSKQAQDEYDALAEEKTQLESEAAKLKTQVTELRAIIDKNEELNTASNTLTQDKYRYQDDYERLLEIADNNPQRAMSYARYPEELAQVLTQYDLDNMKPDGYTSSLTSDNEEDSGDSSTIVTTDPKLKRAQQLATAYTTIVNDNEKIASLSEELNRLIKDTYGISSYNDAEYEYNTIFPRYDSIQNQLDSFDSKSATKKAAVDAAAEDVTNQEAYIQDLSDAQTYVDQAKDAKDALEELIFNQGLADSSNLDMQAAKEAIEKKKEEIKKLEADAEGGEVTAKVSGVIGAINVTAGNTIGPEQALATIQVVDRGYTIKISVTADQAKKVRVGDKADLVNYWGGDIDATLENIANDPSNPGKGKLLVFRLSGEVEPDTNLTLSIGQKSANYDCLVPNSAVRSDSNGSFVLAVVVKSSPLGNRYTATRVDVKVLASDDTMSAVSGLSQGDFVITTSTKPIEAGTLIRLAENG